jgi:single-strand DNA-binding protein
MNETSITIRGRLTADPELRFTPSGAAVVNLTIASNARRFDKTANEWKDGPTTFWRCSGWRDMAENVAESLSKGAAVIAHGSVAQREYETKEGEKRTVVEVELEAIGPDLRWATARPVKAERAKGGFGGAPAAPTADPWAVPAQPAASGWGQPANDEPPF